MRSTLALVFAVATLVGCGGTTSVGSPSTPAGSPPVTVDAGSELAGVAFDVRRDPG